MEANHLNVGKLKKFLWHFQDSKKALQDSEKAKQQVIKQVAKTKSVAVERQKKEAIKAEFEKLEKMLLQVLSNESVMISSQKQDEALSNEIKSKLANVEVRLLEFEKKQKEDVASKLEESNKQMRELKEKLQEYVRTKAEHKERVRELESKIRQKVEKKREILDVEERIAVMEGKLEKIMRAGKFDYKTAENLRSRISDLKNFIKKFR